MKKEKKMKKEVYAGFGLSKQRKKVYYLLKSSLKPINLIFLVMDKVN